MFPLSTGIAVVAGLGLGVLAVLWLVYERRDLRQASGRRPSAHHCVRCDAVYGAPGTAGSTPCPRCGHPNPALRF
jgi:hypothetical protein